MGDKLQKLLELEKSLQIPSLSNDDALAIGLAAIDFVKKNKPRGVYIEIRRGENVIFSFCMEDANWDNRLFAERKLNTVVKFEHCSMLAEEKYKSKGRNFYDYYPPTEYQSKGGGFPLCIPGTGMVGMIGVSGLSAAEDHEVCVEAIKGFLKTKKKGG